jgi:EAL domain-containing protein (putative c-di-GMP-specific phosphodiesterase class I)
MHEVLDPAVDGGRPARRLPRVAWVVIGDPRQASAISDALCAGGWRVPAVLHGVAAARARLQSGGALPDVLVTGLRFDDGDGLRLIRDLGALPGAPAVFIASHQQRAVLKAAHSLADVCGLSFAGACEHPSDARLVATLLAGYRRPPAPGRPATIPAPLSRDDVCALMARDDLFPWMQPKVRLDTREVIGVEALMRGFDEAGQLVTPNRLVPVLARYGLLDDATLRVARKTTDFVVRCLEEGMAISASINVSMCSLARPDFCQQLEAIVQRGGLDPSWITLEITETDAMSDVVQVIENTARIRMFGFNLAIDDFGTAYSSLDQLARIPFSELKIERAFVTGASSDSGKRASLGACAMLGRSLGLQVVAEGVETLEDLDCVRRAGCTHLQGYLVAPPIPVGKALDWLRALDHLRVALP